MLQSLKRSKPLLGTFVEVSLQSSLRTKEDLQFLSSNIFEKITSIQKKMSYFDDKSEISLLNKAQANELITVSKETYELLLFSQKLNNDSKGAFDILYKDRDNFPNVQLTFKDNLQVGKTDCAQIDLGGIAKGYAVDVATQYIESHSDVSGVINAGGDLRVFGNKKFPLHIRSSRNRDEYLDIGSYSNCAVATSDFEVSQTMSTLTVIAKTCTFADSLTKALFRSTKEIKKNLISKYNIKTIWIDANNTISENPI